MTGVGRQPRFCVSPGESVMNPGTRKSLDHYIQTAINYLQPQEPFQL